MHATIRISALLVSVCLLASSGCLKKAVPKPGVTYQVFAITKGNDGTIRREEPGLRAESAAVDDVKEMVHEGGTLLVRIQKTQYEKATFEIIFPDRSTQSIQVKAGAARDVLQKGQRSGVRIEVEESH